MIDWLIDWQRATQDAQSPTEELQSMQEELIACKLREAEANLSLKELQQKVIELKQQWQVTMEMDLGLERENRSVGIMRNTMY